MKFVTPLLLLCLASLVSSLSAHTRGSNGMGLWSLDVEFVPGEGGAKRVTVPFDGAPGIIPRLDTGALRFDRGLIATPNFGAAQVRAWGAFAHWTPEGNAFGKTNEHYGVFTTRPQGWFIDRGGLAVGEDIIKFRFEFDVNFFVDGLGIPNLPIGFHMPIVGLLPEGYSSDYAFEATWEDTTDGVPQAAAVTLSDSATFANPFGSGVLVEPTGALNDSGFFGPITDPSFDPSEGILESFRVHGFYEVNIDKDDVRAMADDEMPFAIRVVPQVGDWAQGPEYAATVIPEPTTLAAFLLAGPMLLIWLRRRR